MSQHLCDFDENRQTDRSLNADQKSPWPQSRRTHHLTYRGHRRSHYRDMGRTLWRKLPPCDFDENRHTDTCLHADQKSQWPRSRRTHRMTYRGHRRSNLPFSSEPSVTSVGQTVGRTTSGPWRLLFSMQRSISTPIFIQIARVEISHRVLAMSLYE